eukprot:GFUD01043205.1.p1 GENE.GFUD01043205.1~~GFUD01043205.1.p1  ORF type:complete len:433 (-),score=105.31 GFUD01043205.1:224-1522(-)
MFSTVQFATLSVLGVALFSSLADSKEKLTVVMVLSEPYLMLREEDGHLGGTSPYEKYEGFSVDLAKVLSKQLGKYLIIRAVTNYGKYDETTGRWSGMVGELIEGTADMAIADLTITDEREKVIDFSVPFMQGGITILYKRITESAHPSDIFSFLDPFTTDVWVVIIACYTVLTILYLITKHIRMKTSKSEQNNETSFSLHLLTITSVIFTIFLACIYTAQLAPFLAVPTYDLPADSVEDLARQNKIKYGMVRSGSTETFFRESQFDTYQQMWRTMSQNYEVFTNSNKEGVDRVQRGNGRYAFLMESNSANYLTERKCDLKTSGYGLLNKINYGIGLPLNSENRKSINQALLKLEAEGTMKHLVMKWWKQKRGGGACLMDMEMGGASLQLSLKNIAGIFLLLLICLIFIILVFGLEWLRSYRQAQDQPSTTEQ